MLIGIGMLRVGSRKEEEEEVLLVYAAVEDDRREKVTYHIIGGERGMG